MDIQESNAKVMVLPSMVLKSMPKRVDFDVALSLVKARLSPNLPTEGGKIQKEGGGSRENRYSVAR